MEAADFSGYATKADLTCSDGRVITAQAFQAMDGQQIPLVWAHQHNSPENILGHGILEARDDGMYVWGFFNDTGPAKHSKRLLAHKDLDSLSIYANQLIENGKRVLHGVIAEVSLVLKGANPGAKIDFVAVAHSEDDLEFFDEEAVIYTGIPVKLEEHLEHAEGDKDDEKDEKDLDDETIGEILETLTPKQKEAVGLVVGAALEEGAAKVQHSEEEPPKTTDGTATHADSTTAVTGNAVGEASTDAASGETPEGTLNHQEGTDMTTTHSVFDRTKAKAEGPTLSHDQLKTIVEDAQKLGSFKDSFLAHAAEYGIEDIDFLFPDAKNITSQPDVIARRTEWVDGVINGAKHSPFSRIKSTAVDLTADAARAKGYVKGNLKKEEVIKLLKRVTTPVTVYKKQKLDRDDIIDITDLDVVSWLKAEMRLMLEEELARAILIGDGREPDDEDKIDEDHLRPIAWDNDMYAHSVVVPTNIAPNGIVETILRSRKHYKGTGTPTLFTTDDILTDMLLIKNGFDQREYKTETELAAALRVSKIVVVEVMEDVPDLLGILVNMADYTIGADRGGALSMFDDFDIDYNQYKYLIETRISGCLTKPKSAVIIKRTSGTTITPQVPSYNPTTKVITIPSQTGVAYYNEETNTVVTGNVTITKTTDIEARPTAGYNFPHNTDADWTYAYTA